MNRAILLILALSVALPTLSQDQDPALLTELRLKERAGFFTLFVPPDYPKAALAAARNATLDVFGAVQPDGSFKIERIEGAEDLAPFEVEIRDVARFWMLRPGYDGACNPTSEPAQVRIWFETREGKPVIAFAQPFEKDLDKTTKDPKLKWARRPKIEYPWDALRARKEGSIEAIVRIQPDGTVDQVHIVPGPLAIVFGPAVEREFPRVLFEPFTGEGAKAVCGSWVVEFRMRP